VVPALDDEWVLGIYRYENRQEKPKYGEGTCQSTTSSSTNPTFLALLGLGRNSGRQCGKVTTNRLSYCTSQLKSLFKLVTQRLYMEDLWRWMIIQVTDMRRQMERGVIEKKFSWRTSSSTAFHPQVARDLNWARARKIAMGRLWLATWTIDKHMCNLVKFFYLTCPNIRRPFNFLLTDQKFLFNNIKYIIQFS
jgi:hypothetical protein